MSTTIVAINAVDDDHLVEVIADMQRLGAPVIRAVKDDGCGVMCALEGSHRLAACNALGITPIIVLLDDDTVIAPDDLGFDDAQNVIIANEDIGMTAGDLRDYISGGMLPYQNCPFYNFAE